MKKVEGMKSSLLEKNCDQLEETDFKTLFSVIQKMELKAPSTSSVLSIGEEGLAKSIKRLGEIDFFSVVSRRPKICDFKPIQVEVAMARLLDKVGGESEDPVQVLRFANRVPLQFDKAGCAIVQAINTVNWRAYGLNQPKDSLPLGPYIIAVSIVSPFIKFKNASKETIDSSEELVEEIRRALIQAGQKLSRHIRREDKANELEEKLKHIEQFSHILIDGLCRITESPEARKKKAEEGLVKLLGRDTKETEQEFKEIQEAHRAQASKDDALLDVGKSDDSAAGDDDSEGGDAPAQAELALEPKSSSKKASKKSVSKKAKGSGKKKLNEANL
jgi:DNA topoisomerase-6 subunit B